MASNNAEILIILQNVHQIARDVAEHTGQTVDAIQNANGAIDRAVAAGATPEQLRPLRENILRITRGAADLNEELIHQDGLAARGERTIDRLAGNREQATDEQLAEATALLTAVQDAPTQAEGYTRAALQVATEAEQLATTAAEAARVAAAERVTQMRQTFTDAIAAAKAARNNANGSVHQIKVQLNLVRSAVTGAEGRGLAQEQTQDLPQALRDSSNEANRQIRERQRDAEIALETANQEVDVLERALETFNANPEAEANTEERANTLRNLATQRVTNATGAAATANTLATEVNGIAQPVIEEANRFFPAPAASLMGGRGRTSTPTVTVDGDEIATQQNLSFAQFQTFLCIKMVHEAYSAETDPTKKATLGAIQRRIAQNNGTAAIEKADIDAIKASSHHAYNGYKIKEATNNGMTLTKKSDNGRDNFTLQFSAHGNNTRCKVSGHGNLVDETVMAAKMLMEASGPGSSNMVSLKLKDKTKLPMYVSAMLNATPPILAVQKMDSTADNIGAAMHATHNKLKQDQSPAGKKLAKDYEDMCKSKCPAEWQAALVDENDPLTANPDVTSPVNLRSGPGL